MLKNVIIVIKLTSPLSSFLTLFQLCSSLYSLLFTLFSLLSHICSAHLLSFFLSIVYLLLISFLPSYLYSPIYFPYSLASILFLVSSILYSFPPIFSLHSPQCLLLFALVPSPSYLSSLPLLLAHGRVSPPETVPLSAGSSRTSLSSSRTSERASAS